MTDRPTLPPATTFDELCDRVDPRQAQAAIIRAMVAAGSEPEWDSETIEYVLMALQPAFPKGLPPVGNEDDEGFNSAYWQAIGNTRWTGVE